MTDTEGVDVGAVSTKHWLLRAGVEVGFWETTDCVLFAPEGKAKP